MVCRRGADGAVLVEGIRQAWVRHSPTRVEGDYGGSGPADLALNILLAVTADRDFAAGHHQAFKWRFVTPLPHRGGTTRAAAVLDWITSKGSEP